jgi:Uma2 family endonuclease
MAVPTTTRMGMPLAEFLEQAQAAPFDLINGQRQRLWPEVAGESAARHAIFQALYPKWNAWMKTTYVRLSPSDRHWIEQACTPDVMVYTGNQIDQFKAAYPDYRERPIPFAPDIVVEVVSPNDKIVELDRKIEAYLADGVQLIWVLYPHSRKAIIYRPNAEQPRHLNRSGVLDGEDVLPDFQLSLAKVFE